MEKDLEAIIEATRVAKADLDLAKAKLRARAIPYEEALLKAKAFSVAFSEYHLAKFGKAKRVDPKGLLR